MADATRHCAICLSLYMYGGAGSGTSRLHCAGCLETSKQRTRERKMHSRSKPWVACETCGQMVPDKKGTARRRFCSYECRDAGVMFGRSCPWPHPEHPIASRVYLWKCEHCGRAGSAPSAGRPRRWCSDRCYDLHTGRLAPSVDITIAPCLRCGSIFTSPAHQAAKFCSTRCNEAERKRQRKHRVRTGGGEKFSTREIAERDDWTCHLCGESVPDKAWDGDIDCATLDHLIPASLGGAHTRDNVKLAHFMCNSLRGATPLEEATCPPRIEATTPAVTPRAPSAYAT